MLNLSKEEKILIIEHAIENIKQYDKNRVSTFICAALRNAIYHYKISSKIYYREVLQSLPEVTQFCPDDKIWDVDFGDVWFPTTVEYNKNRIELLEKSLKLLKNEKTI